MRQPCTRSPGLRIESSSRHPTWRRVVSGFWKRHSRASWQLTGVGSRLFRRSWKRSRLRASARRLTTAEQLDRVRHRYLSTFDLLPPGEYERGLRFLEAEMPRRYRDGFEITAQFTFVGASR